MLLSLVCLTVIFEYVCDLCCFSQEGESENEFEPEPKVATRGAGRKRAPPGEVLTTLCISYSALTHRVVWSRDVLR